MLNVTGSVPSEAQKVWPYQLDVQSGTASWNNHELIFGCRLNYFSVVLLVAHKQRPLDQTQSNEEIQKRQIKRVKICVWSTPDQQDATHTHKQQTNTKWLPMHCVSNAVNSPPHVCVFRTFMNWKQTPALERDRSLIDSFSVKCILLGNFCAPAAYSDH